MQPSSAENPLQPARLSTGCSSAFTMPHDRDRSCSRALRWSSSSPIDRDTVARAAGLSGSHFSHLIREKTGRTFTDLMAQYRVDRAKAMLRRTEKSIIQISFECGSEDQSYFTRVFKRYAGTTPRAYRIPAQSRESVDHAVRRDQ